MDEYADSHGVCNINKREISNVLPKESNILLIYFVVGEDKEKKKQEAKVIKKFLHIK